VLLDGRPGGVRVTLTEIRARTPRHASAPRVAGVLAGLGLLEDDTVPAVRAWIDRRTAGLPPGFAVTVRDWLLVLLDGDAQSRPRPATTIYVYCTAVEPLTGRWSASRGHLREVTADDLRAGLDELRGHPLCTTTPAARSLFRFAKKRGLVFTDPARRVSAAEPEPSLLPVTDDEIRAVEQAITLPGQRLIIALAAVHAARWQAIRALTLDDLDLPSRRITIAGHPRRPGGLSRQALRAWRDYRRATWPHAPSRHVLISEKTALGDVPVTRGYLGFHLKPHGVSVERIRRDRIRPDPLHPSLMFGSSDRPASQYARIARDLLAEPPGLGGDAQPHDRGERE
jgi:integrase